jgi:ubiquitin-conjugating enzyme E2 G1
MAMRRLQAELKQILNEPNPFYSIDIDEHNFLIWNVMLFGPSDGIFEGGIFKCQFNFPLNYPNSPPAFHFITQLFHPNIYQNGKVCISILHEGADEYGYEHISERWNPSHSVNSILMSILTLLNNPNFESPANVDASVMWQRDFQQYKKIVYKTIANSH